MAWLIVVAAFSAAAYRLYKAIKLFIKKDTPCSACPLQKACASKVGKSTGQQPFFKMKPLK